MKLSAIFKRRIEPRADGDRPGGIDFTGLDDPRLLEYIRGAGGIGARIDDLRNMATLRCVSLICESIGMLPLNLLRNDASKAPASDHPAYRLLKLKPNTWQTPYEFKSWMQLQVLLHGNAYARVIWSAGRPIALIPIDAVLVNPMFDRQRLVMRYEVTMPDGQAFNLDATEVLHIRDLSIDSIRGVSRMRLAHGALDLARSVDDATSNIFKTGVLAGGAIEVPKPLSDKAYERMRKSLQEEFSGADSIRKWMLMEEGAKATQFGQSAADSQLIEQRNQQIEEVARAFGVPRPLLMMDDTSWGSGIEQLGIFFVQYGLQHWLTAWEQAVMRVLLSEKDMDLLTVKFNERALLRGTFNDQASYFSKALGAGGSAPWMSQNEVRDLSELPDSDDEQADSLRNPMTQKGTGNEPSQAA